MKTIPAVNELDSTLSLFRDGNNFIWKRCQQYGTDIFECRLLFKKTVCLSGKEAAEAFYNRGSMTRQGAIPQSVLRLLQDKGSVATLDGKQHALRKALFMSTLSTDAIATLIGRIEYLWRQTIERWPVQRDMVFLEHMQTVLGLAVCDWCGLSDDDRAVRDNIPRIAAMINGAGAFGVRNWAATMQRKKTEDWLQKAVRHVREGNATARKDSPLWAYAHYEEEGEPLSEEVAAIELLNLIRPTIAVGHFLQFAALALHFNPHCKTRILESEDYLEWFIQEVRRFYPFFPFVGGIATQPFEWRDHVFPPGTRFLLDLYGTNHDSRIWADPQRFEPERFQSWQDDEYSLIPQGGGNYQQHHRCAGEQLTIKLMKTLVNLLVTELNYKVIHLDYSVDLSRMPARPKQPFTIRKI
jgi:fatty-acid peroxygenase